MAVNCDSGNVNTVGEPCEGKPHARFDEGRLERPERLNQSPTLRNYGPPRKRIQPSLERALVRFIQNGCVRL